MKRADPIFIDFEASSLSSDSWPIEVGLSTATSERVATWSSLIRPRATWSMDAWSPQSAWVHGIALADLQEAPPADLVAAEVVARIAGRVLVSDAPEFEIRWLRRLLETCGAGGIEIQDFDTMAARRFDGGTLDWVYEGLERRRAPHRAGPDSARLAGAWMDGLRRMTL